MLRKIIYRDNRLTCELDQQYCMSFRLPLDEGDEMKLVGWQFLLPAVLACFGFYRGWFSLSTQNAVDRSRKVDVNLSVNGDKLESDTNAAKEKIRELKSGDKE